MEAKKKTPEKILDLPLPRFYYCVSKGQKYFSNKCDDAGSMTFDDNTNINDETSGETKSVKGLKKLALQLMHEQKKSCISMEKKPEERPSRCNGVCTCCRKKDLETSSSDARNIKRNNWDVRVASPNSVAWVSDRRQSSRNDQVKSVSRPSRVDGTILDNVALIRPLDVSHLKPVNLADVAENVKMQRSDSKKIAETFINNTKSRSYEDPNCANVAYVKPMDKKHVERQQRIELMKKVDLSRIREGMQGTRSSIIVSVMEEKNVQPGKASVSQFHQKGGSGVDSPLSKSTQNLEKGAIIEKRCGSATSSESSEKSECNNSASSGMSNSMSSLFNKRIRPLHEAHSDRMNQSRIKYPEPLKDSHTVSLAEYQRLETERVRQAIEEKCKKKSKTTAPSKSCAIEEICTESSYAMLLSFVHNDTQPEVTQIGLSSSRTLKRPAGSSRHAWKEAGVARLHKRPKDGSVLQLRNEGSNSSSSWKRLPMIQQSLKPVDAALAARKDSASCVSSPMGDRFVSTVNKENNSPGVENDKFSLVQEGKRTSQTNLAVIDTGTNYAQSFHVDTDEDMTEQFSSRASTPVYYTDISAKKAYNNGQDSPISPERFNNIESEMAVKCFATSDIIAPRTSTHPITVTEKPGISSSSAIPEKINLGKKRKSDIEPECKVKSVRVSEVINIPDEDMANLIHDQQLGSKITDVITLPKINQWENVSEFEGQSSSALMPKTKDPLTICKQVSPASNISSEDLMSAKGKMELDIEVSEGNHLIMLPISQANAACKEAEKGYVCYDISSSEDQLNTTRSVMPKTGHHSFHKPIENNGKVASITSSQTHPSDKASSSSSGSKLVGATSINKELSVNPASKDISYVGKPSVEVENTRMKLINIKTEVNVRDKGKLTSVLKSIPLTICSPLSDNITASCDIDVELSQNEGDIGKDSVNAKKSMPTLQEICRIAESSSSRCVPVVGLMEKFVHTEVLLSDRELNDVNIEVEVPQKSKTSGKLCELNTSEGMTSSADKEKYDYTSRASNASFNSKPSNVAQLQLTSTMLTEDSDRSYFLIKNSTVVRGDKSKKKLSNETCSPPVCALGSVTQPSKALINKSISECNNAGKKCEVACVVSKGSDQSCASLCMDSTGACDNVNAESLSCVISASLCGSSSAVQNVDGDGSKEIPRRNDAPSSMDASKSDQPNVCKDYDTAVSKNSPMNNIVSKDDTHNVSSLSYIKISNIRGSSLISSSAEMGMNMLDCTNSICERVAGSGNSTKITQTISFTNADTSRRKTCENFAKGTNVEACKTVDESKLTHFSLQDNIAKKTTENENKTHPSPTVSEYSVHQNDPSKICTVSKKPPTSATTCKDVAPAPNPSEDNLLGPNSSVEMGRIEHAHSLPCLPLSSKLNSFQSMSLPTISPPVRASRQQDSDLLFTPEEIDILSSVFNTRPFSTSTNIHHDNTLAVPYLPQSKESWNEDRKSYSSHKSISNNSEYILTDLLSPLCLEPEQKESNVEDDIMDQHDGINQTNAHHGSVPSTYPSLSRGDPNHANLACALNATENTVRNDGNPGIPDVPHSFVNLPAQSVPSSNSAISKGASINTPSKKHLPCPDVAGNLPLGSYPSSSTTGSNYNHTVPLPTCYNLLSSSSLLHMQKSNISASNCSSNQSVIPPPPYHSTYRHTAAALSNSSSNFSNPDSVCLGSSITVQPSSFPVRWPYGWHRSGLSHLQPSGPTATVTTDAPLCFVCVRSAKIKCKDCGRFFYCSNHCYMVHWNYSHCYECPGRRTC